MHVGIFSGCSIHSLCRIPASSNLLERLRSCVSPLASRTTCMETMRVLCWSDFSHVYSHTQGYPVSLS